MPLLVGFFATIQVYAALISVPATAQTLAPLPKGNVQRLALSDKSVQYGCHEIVDKLVAYNDMARQHDQSISTFLSEVADRLGSWFTVLLPFEGGAQPVAEGTFAPLQSGSEHILKITDMAYENSSLLAAEMDNILTSLQACKVEQAQGSFPQKHLAPRRN
jgi:hypothetical protein